MIHRRSDPNRAPSAAYDAGEKHTWFSAVTAFRAAHFTDASALPYIGATLLGLALVAASFTDNVGGFNRLVAILGVIAILIGGRVLIGQALARVREEPGADDNPD
jgi:hypothetical protein